MRRVAAVVLEGTPADEQRRLMRRRQRAPRPRPRPVDLDTIAAGWRRALDAAQRATQLASAPPIGAHVAADVRALTNERLAVSAELREIARLQGRPAPWLRGFP